LVPESSDALQIIPPFTSLSTFETALLDLDGRVERSQRPNGNAWKTFTVWKRRTPSSEMSIDAESERGGRESYGTLFYLRGNYYHEDFQS